MNMSSIDNYPLLGTKVNKEQYQVIDLSINGDFYQNLTDDNWGKAFLSYARQKNKILYGGYLEERFFYLNKALFGTGNQRRKYHLAVDLWTDAMTDIFCPLAATVHSLAYNQKHLDYGYTIILRHDYQDQRFYSLYGHLSSEHLSSLKINEVVRQGQKLCNIGDYDENGHWPPHLHFQLIMDIADYNGDYPGVSNAENLAFYKNNCPDPTSFVIG